MHAPREANKETWGELLFHRALQIAAVLLFCAIVWSFVGSSFLSPEEREQMARMEAAYRETSCTCEDALAGGVIGGGVPRDTGGGGCPCGQEDW